MEAKKFANVTQNVVYCEIKTTGGHNSIKWQTVRIIKYFAALRTRCARGGFFSLGI